MSPDTNPSEAVTEAWYEQYLQLNPLTATTQGDHRYDDQFGDYVSERWMADWFAIEQEALEKLRAIDPAKLTGEDLLTYESFKYGREIAIEGFRYPSELLPVNQFGGLHTYFAVLGSGLGAHPFKTAQDYDNFLARMDGFVEWVDQAINNMRTGVAKGVVLPRVVVERMIPQLAAIAVCYTHAMTSDQHIWQSWARTIDKWGCINLVTAFLEAAGPLTTLGAQFIYLGQPYLRFIIHSEQLLALTDILEDPGQTHRFIQYLREESPT